jgi:hypothetical protein
MNKLNFLAKGSFLLAALTAGLGLFNVSAARADSFLMYWQNPDGSMSDVALYPGSQGYDYVYPDWNNGRFVSGIYKADGSYDGYWVQDSSGTRCDSMVNGSYYWGTITFLPSDANGDGVSDSAVGSWGYCGNSQPYQIGAF